MSKNGGKMERKFKIMGMYLGMLFFVSIILILITSLSNSKFKPAYSAEEISNQKNSGFNSTMQESVTSLTQTNQNLNNKVKEQNEKIGELERIIYEKDELINDYKKIYNEDTENLYMALKFYASNDIEKLRNTAEIINRDNLNPENQAVYDNLLNKLQ